MSLPDVIRQNITIENVELNVSKVSKAGKPYLATVLHGKNGRGEDKQHTLVGQITRTFGNLLSTLKVGDVVTITSSKSPQGFFTPTNIEKKDHTPQTTAKTGEWKPRAAYDPTGQKIGNSVTNAVQLAIHKAGPKGAVTKELLEESFLLVWNLHLSAEELIKKPSTDGVEELGEDESPF